LCVGEHALLRVVVAAISNVEKEIAFPLCDVFGLVPRIPVENVVHDDFGATSRDFFLVHGEVALSYRHGERSVAARLSVFKQHRRLEGRKGLPLVSRHDEKDAVVIVLGIDTHLEPPIRCRVDPESLPDSVFHEASFPFLVLDPVHVAVGVIIGFIHVRVVVVAVVIARQLVVRIIFTTEVNTRKIFLFGARQFRRVVRHGGLVLLDVILEFGVREGLGRVRGVDRSHEKGVLVLHVVVLLLRVLVRTDEVGGSVWFHRSQPFLLESVQLVHDFVTALFDRVVDLQCVDDTLLCALIVFQVIQATLRTRNRVRVSIELVHVIFSNIVECVHVDERVIRAIDRFRPHRRSIVSGDRRVRRGLGLGLGLGRGGALRILDVLEQFLARFLDALAIDHLGEKHFSALRRVLVRVSRCVRRLRDVLRRGLCHHVVRQRLSYVTVTIWVVSKTRFHDL